jgi:acyl dehydratase
MPPVPSLTPLYFEDVVEGQEYVSAPRKVTENDLLSFTDISGDRHPIHRDAEYARSTVFGQRILQGPFGIAVAMGMFGEFTELMDAAIALTDIREWRFLAPVFVGDAAHANRRQTSIKRRGPRHRSAPNDAPQPAGQERAGRNYGPDDVVP